MIAFKKKKSKNNSMNQKLSFQCYLGLFLFSLDYFPFSRDNKHFPSVIVWETA